MHLTGGQYKGRIVSTPCGEGRGEHGRSVKPTLSKVRESVFNVLSSHFLSSAMENSEPNNVFSKLSFLDMFTGSGIMALEAYSRGFGEVFAIEKCPRTYSLIKKTFSAFCADISLLRADAIKAVPKLQEFDVIYIDPPWDFDYEPIINTAYEKLATGGVIVVEYDVKNSKGTAGDFLHKKEAKSACQRKENAGIQILPFKEKIYGRCKLDFYTK